MILAFLLVGLLQDWSAPTTLVSSQIVYHSLAACGTTVHSFTGDGTIKYRRSQDEGLASSWEAPRSLTGGYLYPERPVACDRATVVVAFAKQTRLIVDWCLTCKRLPGNLYILLSTDNGTTWAVPKQITFDQGAFRFSITVSAQRIGVNWQNWRGPTDPGTWDVQFASSTDLGKSFTVETLVVGEDQYGAERPSLVAAESGWIAAWMANAQPPCETEPCFVVFASVNNGSWNPSVQVGPAYPPNTLRPSLALAQSAVLLGHDANTGSGSDTDQALSRSLDGGVNWSPSVPVVANPASNDNHGVIVSGLGDDVYLTWIAAVPPDEYAQFVYSMDAGVIWSDVETLPFNKTRGIPASARSSNYVHVQAVSKGVGLQITRRLF
jgi:hypothetical protein